MDKPYWLDVHAVCDRVLCLIAENHFQFIKYIYFDTIKRLL